MEPKIIRENSIGYIISKVHVWKWPVVKDKHIKMKPRIYVLFVFDLHGWIGDSVYRKMAAKNIFL